MNLATIRPLKEVWQEFNDSVITIYTISAEDAEVAETRCNQFIFDDEERAERLIEELIISAANEGHQGFQLALLGSKTRVLVCDIGPKFEPHQVLMKVRFGLGSWCEISECLGLRSEMPGLQDLAQRININPEKYIPADVQTKMMSRGGRGISSPSPAPAEITFSDEQQGVIDEVVESAKSGKSGFYFVTGKAGTGKSTVSRAIQKELEGSCIVLAPTGIAAVNVGGQTIHSFFGLGVSITDLTEERRMRDDKLNVVRKAKVIFIDEVSMVRADLMDAIDGALQRNLEVAEPFGGKLIIAFGDNWQLDPVLAGNEVRIFEDRGYRSKFWFDAAVFTDGLFPCPIHSTELTEVFRQKGDTEFIDALNQSRKGESSGIPVFNSRVTKSGLEPEPITITFTNNKADQINQSRLRQIQLPPSFYEAEITGAFGVQFPAEPRLELKVGARVMVLRNMRDDNARLVANGSTGSVTFLDDAKVGVRLDDGRTIEVAPETWEKIDYSAGAGGITANVIGEFKQIPLRLAYAITAHKSQGQTFENCHLALERPAFSHGQTYVALSRCKSLSGMSLARPLLPADLLVDSRVVEWDSKQFAGVAK